MELVRTLLLVNMINVLQKYIIASIGNSKYVTVRLVSDLGHIFTSIIIRIPA